MKIWITKDALTTGIRVIDADVFNNTELMFCRDKSTNEVFSGTDWHGTRDKALRVASNKRHNKLNAEYEKLEKLRANINMLRNITFMDTP